MITLPLLLAASALTCGTPSAAGATGPQHFIFFGRDHERVADTAFLDHPGVAGAQVTYTWRELEPRRDAYDFATVRAHIALLKRHGKRLFIQLQDVSFSDRVLVPQYLLEDTAFHGGAVRKAEGSAATGFRYDGWVARRWDAAVRERHARLAAALAREFDGVIEGVVLPETAIGFRDPASHPPGFTFETYAAGVREMLSNTRRAFQRSCVVIYANFMPGEWLPADDRGYLRGIYEHAAHIGAGVGGPDIMPSRPGQRAHSLALVAARPAGVAGAMAVQDGNLAERDPATGKQVTARELLDFAVGRLRLDYMFWSIEEPYYSADVLPLLRALHARQRPSP